MNVVAVNIRAPGNDVPRMRKLFRLGAELNANHRLQAFFACRGADAALQLRSAQAVEETAVHGSAVERAQRASVRVGQDRFAPVFGNDPAQAMRNFVKSLVPGDALPNSRRDSRPRLSMRSAAPLQCGAGALSRVCLRSLGSYPSHRIQHATRRVHAVQIFGDFRAKESAGNGVFWIALNLDGAAVFNGDQNAAGVRTIVRAGGVNDALHPRIIVETGLAPSPAAN